MTSSIPDYEAQRRALESDLYDESVARHALVSEMANRIQALHKNAPTGLLQLKLEVLAEDGARYALLDFAGKRAIIYGARLSFATFRVEQRGGHALVIRESVGGEETVAGRITPDCRYPVGRTGDADNEPHPWDEFYFAGAGRTPRAALLPLAGSMLAHPVFAAMARFAEAALGHHIPEIAEIDTIDRRMDALEDAREYLRGKIEDGVYGDIDIATLEAGHAGLIHTLRSHDWTWHEADRPNWAMAEIEEKLMADLARLPEDHARALWFRHNPYALSYSPWSRAAARIARLRGAKRPRATLTLA